MDVILTSTYDMVAVSTSVTYDIGNGLVLASMYEWRGVGVSFDKQGQPRKYCTPAGGLLDYGGVVQSFDCTIPEPSNPPVLPAGTYRIGTLVWDTSGFVGLTSTIAAYINDYIEDGVGAVINGNVIFLTKADIVVRSHVLFLGDPTICGDAHIMPTEQCDDGGITPGDGCDADCQIEPGWTCEGEPSVCTELAAVPSMSATGVTVLGVGVFGIGLVGLVIAARRRFN
jgi:cysteine-rich repeat protein